MHKIKEDQYKILLNFGGYGDFKNVQICVIGNEEGLGGLSVSSNIGGRCKYFGKDEHGKYINNIGNVYWEPSTLSGKDKVIRYADENGINEPWRNLKFTKGNFLRCLARIFLTLENYNGLDYFNSDTETSAAINTYILNDMFGVNDHTKDNSKIKTTLIDWRPLPRRNESESFDDIPEYKDFIKNKPYIDAFNFKSYSTRRSKSQELINYHEKYKIDVDARVNAIKTMFNNFPIPIVLSLGQVQMREKLFKKVFHEIEFAPLFSKVVGMGIDKEAGKIAKYNGRTIILIPHPEYRKFNGIRLEFMKELTFRYIKPEYDKLKSDCNFILK